jgi:uncharacterized membrane protein/membrane-bound inhibitor of C-type lysozyme
MTRAAFGAICLVAVAGCASERAEEAPASHAPAGEPRARVTMVYECDAGFTFVATVRNDTAWVFLPSVTVSLPHVPSASGARYSDGTTTLWTKGEEAVLDAPADSIRGCVNNRARAIWEHAKLGGVDFRAVGNEPGWHMELSHDSILLVTDYGEHRYAFPTPVVEASPAERRSAYRSSLNGHHLEVLLEARECRDIMSGEAFETTVTVTVDGRILRGCGRALH